MPTTLPFAMTPEAADYVRCRLEDYEPGRQPRLIRGFGFADALSDAVYFEGEHFQLIYEEKPIGAAQGVELFGHLVAITGDTLKRLTNRMLMLHTIPRPAGASQYVLLSP